MFLCMAGPKASSLFWPATNLDPKGFNNRQAGRLIKTPQGFYAFVPAPSASKLSCTAETALPISKPRSLCLKWLELDVCRQTRTC